jgi:hypothetical protein
MKILLKSFGQGFRDVLETQRLGTEPHLKNLKDLGIFNEPQLADMRILGKSIEQRFRDVLESQRFGTELHLKNLEDLGIFSEPQLADIKAQLRGHGKGEIALTQRFEVNLEKAGYKSEEEFQKAVEGMPNDFSSYLEKARGKLNDRSPAAVMETLDWFFNIILDNLKSDSGRILEERAKSNSLFESDLFTVWGDALNLLEMIIVISIETAESCHAQDGAASLRKKGYVFEALIRLHARACQVACEVLVLLKSGFADGAHARWRSLHEVAVIADLICSNGEDLAERYLLHDGIECFKAAEIYQKRCLELGEEPLTDAEFSELEKTHDDLIGRFGKDYRNEYGWASGVVKKKNPLFRDLENFSDIKNRRPDYKMACHNVHANSRSLFFRLGLNPESKDALLNGPSYHGLSVSVRLTALSLTQVTGALLSSYQTDYKTSMNSLILFKLQREVKKVSARIEDSPMDK